MDGTFAPFLRASERPIAIACLRLLTLPPLPPLPELLFADEVLRLLDAASEEPRCQSLVYLMLYGGLKKEEDWTPSVGRERGGTER